MSLHTSLPHWDLSTVYPEIASPAFQADFHSVTAELAALETLFATYHVGDDEPQRSPSPVSSQAHTPSIVEELITQYNAVLTHINGLQQYLYCVVAVNTQDSTAQAYMSEFQQSLVRFTQLTTRFTAWTRSLDVERLAEQSAIVYDHTFVLQQAQIRAHHQLSPAEEALAAELSVPSGTAWGNLHKTITSQLMVKLEQDGQLQEFPISMLPAFAVNPDRDLRRRAYAAEIAAWESVAVPLAAALNSIKGQVNILTRRRGWTNPLDEALFNASIDHETLDAMLTAAQAAFPDFRRYLQAKARALHLPTLAWYDRFVPLTQTNSDSTWGYEQATDFIIEQFGTYTPSLREFAARAFREHWIDAEPRAGKQSGAFCTPMGLDQSRILTNYQASFNSVLTLAHELGHGYHNLQLARRSMLQRELPMTLAETASIFCETLVRQAALKITPPQERVVLIEGFLQSACQLVVNVTGAFLFEQRLFAQRWQRELSVDELRQTMLDAWYETYGDAQEKESLHPYMWAAMPHFYSTSRSFYNFPYMFGLLFGLGLYACYQQDPDHFKQGYDELLSSTGRADAATLARGFAIDIRDPAFWQQSIDIVRNDITTFEALVDELSKEES